MIGLSPANDGVVVANGALVVVAPSGVVVAGDSNGDDAG